MCEFKIEGLGEFSFVPFLDAPVLFDMRCAEMARQRRTVKQLRRELSAMLRRKGATVPEFTLMMEYIILRHQSFIQLCQSMVGASLFGQLSESFAPEYGAIRSGRIEAPSFRPNHSPEVAYWSQAEVKRYRALAGGCEFSRSTRGCHVPKLCLQITKCFSEQYPYYTPGGGATAHCALEGDGRISFCFGFPREGIVDMGEFLGEVRSKVQEWVYAFQLSVEQVTT